MSFRINTNLAAMGVHGNLLNSSSELNQSIARLSTGLRINTAGDDPAALIASESFRSQINSIDAATRNNQDAINYSKTAEAALGEVNRLLTDARALVITSGNTATLSASQIQANQDQLNSIASSISRIATNTQFGTRRLLDGSSGIQSQVSNSSIVGGISMVGTFNGSPVTNSAYVTLSAMVTTGARASFTSSTLTGGNVLNTGTFNLNGVTFNIEAGTTGAGVALKINEVSNQTGVTANFNTGTNVLTLSSTQYGSASQINFTDASGVISPAGTIANRTGRDAVGRFTIDGTNMVLFTGGRYGQDGLSLSDTDGNMIRLTEAGNVSTGAITVGQISAGTASFQIGANANQTAQLSLPNLLASQLGAGIVSGYNLSNLDVSNEANSANALKIIDRAIDEVSSSRGRIGQFTRYVLESNNRSLATAKENISASESAIRDVDMASEMTNFTKYQVLQQAGISILAQANSIPQRVLSLIQGN